MSNFYTANCFRHVLKSISTSLKEDDALSDSFDECQKINERKKHISSGCFLIIFFVLQQPF
jgi:hypothetical protein